MSEISIDVAEITGPMVLKRDELLAEAEEADKQAAYARESARDAAAKVLQRGEDEAESWEGSAARKRAYAARWDVIIAREETEAAQSAAATRSDGEVAG
jgi:hypothetical protein